MGTSIICQSALVSGPLTGMHIAQAMTGLNWGGGGEGACLHETRGLSTLACLHAAVDALYKSDSAVTARYKVYKSREDVP